ncbi:cell envelope integrity protein TolA [Microvirga alba]|uniref:Cell envelope integrity protein TolA n=1 Tax=Microvirga alba TaxID=2791025 RepID=A0A931FNY6_9HYPH|nr:cell envelope integrity protein TolA [Microvirga alba]MBF9234170.1 cell envelope integrity protein TolA [Microvirga alba]
MRCFGLTMLLLMLASAATADAMTNEKRDAFFRLFRDQIVRCYTLPPGARSAEVRVEIRLAPDGSLPQPPKVLGSPADSEAARAALRAIKRCAPFHIPAAFKSSYGEWKRIQMIFGFD